MKNVKVTGAQYKVLQILSRKDISAIHRNPKLVPGAKHLLLACKKTIKKLEDDPAVHLAQEARDRVPAHRRALPQGDRRGRALAGSAANGRHDRRLCLCVAVTLLSCNCVSLAPIPNDGRRRTKADWQCRHSH